VGRSRLSRTTRRTRNAHPNPAADQSFLIRAERSVGHHAITLWKHRPGQRGGRTCGFGNHLNGEKPCQRRVQPAESRSRLVGSSIAAPRVMPCRAIAVPTRCSPRSARTASGSWTSRRIACGADRASGCGRAGVGPPHGTTAPRPGRMAIAPSGLRGGGLLPSTPDTWSPDARGIAGLAMRFDVGSRGSSFAPWTANVPVVARAVPVI